MHPFYMIIAVSTSCISWVRAGTVLQGGKCSSNSDYIDPISQRFVAECSDKTFCSAAVNGTCVPKTCRFDEFPFGYDPGDILPPLCPAGEFCPDEGSGCQALLSVGQTCQHNKDNQCAPPANWKQLSSEMNVNGSICLLQKCSYANATLGQACQLENTTYTGNDPSGQQVVFTITRDSCYTPDLFCDPSVSQCVTTHNLGSSCRMDRECETNDCSPQGKCVFQPETPLSITLWQYILTGACVVGVILITCASLRHVRSRARVRQHLEIRDYYHEQNSLRRSIILLHNAASSRYMPVDSEKVPLFAPTSGTAK
ncbi:hypothetical protein FIBSPDRAFT_1046712 [Athelia psychrophila]|uniref:Dickkopf N-terminal cysteine-rich domain-containing protein n=1 Tax=Athelia psychrophila TaxID=1759441 RepID=A0A166GD51_9AGAM|nr:hypothetical protein FIBSPDRAFT_1046712 [Fibularhizoctonia sp. CBS 109695]